MERRCGKSGGGVKRTEGEEMGAEESTRKRKKDEECVWRDESDIYRRKNDVK